MQMSTKPKILIINNGLSGGGTERASVSLAHYLLKERYLVAILALYKTEHFFELDPGVKFIEPVFERKNNSAITYILRLLKFIRKNIIREAPDRILSFNEWTNAYVILASLGLGIPLYVSERMHPKAKLPFVTEVLRKLLYKKCAGVITQTQFGKSIIQKKTGAKNVAVIPNPVNMVEPVPVPRLNRVVSVGRLEKVKGHRYLIEAFAKIKNNSWNLSIVGTGSERLNLENQASDLGIAHRVIFHGHLLDFRKQLSEAKIYVLPSLKEGFPNSLIEAMSLPIACISGDFYEGEHDLIQNEYNGLLFQPGNADDLAAAINRLIEDENLRNKLESNAVKVREDFSFEKIAGQYICFMFNHYGKE